MEKNDMIEMDKNLVEDIKKLSPESQIALVSLLSSCQNVMIKVRDWLTPYLELECSNAYTPKCGICLPCKSKEILKGE